jgi:hypothetical protein
MTDRASGRQTLQPRLFDPLEQTDFVRLEHASSLKGLLRPFKGKGELIVWAKQSESLRDGLTSLAQRLLSQATRHPFNLLPVVLAQQSTGAGTTFLRWRNADRSAMGVSLWSELIADPRTPAPLVHELFAIELQRIALNMQISLTHTIARQASQCAEKMAQAEALYLRRTDRQIHHVSKESMS